MTALQDWLSIGRLNPRTLRLFVCGVLRSGPREGRTEVRYDPPRIRPGVERC